MKESTPNFFFDGSLIDFSHVFFWGEEPWLYTKSVLWIFRESRGKWTCPPSWQAMDIYIWFYKNRLPSVLTVHPWGYVLRIRLQISSALFGPP
jgi:hypothetical protein